MENIIPLGILLGVIACGITIYLEFKRPLAQKDEEIDEQNNFYNLKEFDPSKIAATGWSVDGGSAFVNHTNHYGMIDED